MITPTRIALDLSTDLGNIKNYTGNAALVAALVFTAEEKIATLTAYLADIRREAGMNGCATIIDINRAA